MAETMSLYEAVRIARKFMAETGGLSLHVTPGEPGYMVASHDGVLAAAYNRLAKFHATLKDDR
jgi:hypothetical protein